jgi:formylglycine-generating enzyme required for sulfatase activity
MRVLLAVLLVGIAGCGGEDNSPGDVAAPSSPTSSPVKAENAEAGAPKTKPVKAENAEAGAPKTKPVSPGSEPNVPGGMEVTNSVGMKLRLIPAGKFMMGSPRSEPHRYDNEIQHRVSITKPFYLGVTEVTQEQYQKVMGTDPSHFKGPQNPVEKVSWTDAVEFCRKLSAMPAEKTAGHVYRLPTEAEWEYACRSGTTTACGFGDDVSRLGDYGWFVGNSDSSTHPVGEKKPNAWGLYDMHGNVWEWCQDWYGRVLDSATDPTGAMSGSLRVLRGGSWSDDAGDCRSADRLRDSPRDRGSALGFRVLRSSIGSAAGGGVKPGERSGSVGPSGASGAATRGAGVQAE